MVVDCLVFRVVCLVEGKRVARMLELDSVISDIETASGTAKTHEDGSLEWGVDGGNGKVGDNGDRSCALAPAVLCVQH